MYYGPWRLQASGASVASHGISVSKMRAPMDIDSWITTCYLRVPALMRTLVKKDDVHVGDVKDLEYAVSGNNPVITAKSIDFMSIILSIIDKFLSIIGTFIEQYSIA